MFHFTTEFTTEFTKWLQQGAIAFRSAAFLLAPALAMWRKLSVKMFESLG